MHSSGSSDFPSMMWPGVEGVCVCGGLRERRSWSTGTKLREFEYPFIIFQGIFDKSVIF